MPRRSAVLVIAPALGPRHLADEAESHGSHFTLFRLPLDGGIHPARPGYAASALPARDDGRVRYDWDRYGHRRTAIAVWAETQLLTGFALAGCPLLLLEAATRDWTIAFPALLAGTAAAVQRAAVRRVYGVREPGTAEAEEPQTQAEALADAIERRRERQWAAIAEQAYLARGGKTRPPAGRADPEPAVMRPSAGAVRLDPRWEWKLVRHPGAADEWVKVRCLHAEVEPVESAGEVVAQLCLTCDTQFPAPREQ